MKIISILLLLFLNSCAYIQCVDTARRASEKMVTDMEEINNINPLYSIKILDYGCDDNTPWIQYEIDGRCRKTELYWYKLWYEGKKITIIPQEGE